MSNSRSMDVVEVNPVVIVKEDTADQLENLAFSTAYTLDKTIDKLLKPEDEDHVPTADEVDSAIQCANSMIQMMAVFHKGREIKNRTNLLIGGSNGSAD